jgi:hypothetical protein
LFFIEDYTHGATWSVDMAMNAIIALMMEAASTSETLVNLYQTTRRYKAKAKYRNSRNEIS